MLYFVLLSDCFLYRSWCQEIKQLALQYLICVCSLSKCPLNIQVNPKILPQLSPNYIWLSKKNYILTDVCVGWGSADLPWFPLSNSATVIWERKWPILGHLSWFSSARQISHPHPWTKRWVQSCTSHGTNRGTRQASPSSTFHSFVLPVKPLTSNIPLAKVRYTNAKATDSNRCGHLHDTNHSIRSQKMCTWKEQRICPMKADYNNAYHILGAATGIKENWHPGPAQ